MGNKFVDYLNSMNNADSSNENALAESQVLSEYYDFIKIERKLGEYIYDCLIKDEKKAIILTGHAGDGKTSILIQILNKMGYFNEGKKLLTENELYKNLLFYVKDMSELNEEKRKDALNKFLTYADKGVSSLLISNTGPLINTFKNILNKEQFDELENDLLSRLDNNDLKEIEVCIDSKKSKFTIINMAKLDNIYILEELLDKFIQTNLWESCTKCEANSKCPIYFNYLLCKEHKDRISDIIQKIYLWLKENESRLTVRQIISHLSFAITGNLSCQEIINTTIYKNDVLFDYSFANLFFGYKGTSLIKDSLNIKAIRELNKVSFYKKALHADYKLFVDEKYDMFDEKITNILEEKINANQENLGIAKKKGINIREAFRRYYIMLSDLHGDDYNELIKNILSKSFFQYDHFANQKMTLKEINEIRDIVFIGLYKMYIGVYPSEDEKTLYLTLKKNLDEVQNVQLILGEINKNNDIKIVQEKIKDVFNESNVKFRVYIKFGNSDERLYLNLQTIQYFEQIKNGEIFTSFNPNFTVGINRIRASLLNNYRYNKDYESNENREIRLLIIKREGTENVNIIIEDNDMQVY